MAEDASIGRFVRRSSELEPEMFSEDINVLNDLLEHVEHNIQGSYGMLSDPINSNREELKITLDAPFDKDGGDLEDLPQLSSIDPFEVGETLAEDQVLEDMLEASREDTRSPQTFNPSNKDPASHKRGLESLELRALVLSLASEDGEGALEAFVSSNGSVFEVQHGNTRVTLPSTNRDDSGLSSIGNVIEPQAEDVVEVLAPPRLHPKIRPNRPPHEREQTSETDLFAEEIDADFINFVDAALYRAEETPEEKKVPISRSLKIDVPKLSPVQFTHGLCDQSRDDIISDIFDELNLNLSWSMQRLEEDRKMNWVPFKHSTMINLEETISDDSERFLKLISPPTDVVQSAQLLFKEPGLRILDSNEYDEEELEVREELANLIPEQDTPSIPRKRPSIDHLLANLPVKRVLQCTSDNVADRDVTTERLKQPLSGAFSASNALDTFLDLRGSKFKRMPLTPTRLSADEIEDDPIQTQTQENSLAKVSRAPQQCSESLINTASTIQVPATPMPASTHKQQEIKIPKSKSLSWRRSIMVDTCILKTHRSLLAFLEHRGGCSLDIIYREMSSDHGYSNAKPDHPEIILNPVSCLIFTNLQAINQRSLPGQNATSSDNKVRRKVQVLAQDYDHVFVVATVSRILGDAFPQSHMDVISTFTGYCASFMSAIVTPVWVVPEKVPAKTDAAINAWTWSLICQHAFPASKQSSPVTLIHDETSWEHFLRKAGMNPMSSQVVLGMLHKDSSTQEDHANEPWGLSRLVRMSTDERMKSFEGVIGERAVGRISAALDREWN
ncbi:uncharacterized protein A1O9_08121 [Exophiala aquamarina CBS 119918]|uniref:Uncharacterized protein n=1 Tax=Exophiala aquamarina CBS 119918 TaxID=1182545 RepID=A0A072P697_9EURO|nr:uncharacterized protein A1O9_08121 [Exophiala aquamarina CBS 119918]KEF55371.1 hypothetical protein A1O9_08121 [Exophiala aquamarina CBS 119918]